MICAKHRRAALAAAAALVACDASTNEASPTPSATEVAPADVEGVFCAVTQGSACYELDVPKMRVTLVMGDQRGRSFPLERRDESAFSFALAPNQLMWLRVRDADTLEVSSAADTQSFIVLERRR